MTSTTSPLQFMTARELCEHLDKVDSPPLALGHTDLMVTPESLDCWLSKNPLPTTCRTIVAFAGLAGSGKSTAALRLVERHGFHRVRFAGPLKDMMRALGLNEQEIEGDLKEKPCALLGGKTPRYAMQTIGTEWGRDIIDRDLWIRAWQSAVDKVPPGAPVVVDDCRFPNEADAVTSAGGIIVRVVRPGVGAGAAGHSSESYTLPAALDIVNDGQLVEFLSRVDQFAVTASWAFADRDAIAQP